MMGLIGIAAAVFIYVRRDYFIRRCRESDTFAKGFAAAGIALMIIIALS